MKLALILMAFLLSAETPKVEVPVIPDAERAKVYKLLWQQQSAQSQIEKIEQQLKAAREEMGKVTTKIMEAMKPLHKDGYEITDDLTYRPKEQPKPNQLDKPKE